MIEKYYDGAIEQVAAGLGTVEKNYLLVRYSGQFSVENLNDTMWTVRCMRAVWRDRRRYYTIIPGSI